MRDGRDKQSANTFRGWRKSKRLGKTTDPLMQFYREEVAKREWDETQVLDALKEAGVRWQL